MASGCSGRSWETPGAGGRLCPVVHALLYRLPHPVFACGILGTRASSLWSCYITAPLPSLGSALQQAGAEAGTRKKACSPDGRLPKSIASACALPPCRGRGLNKQSASSTFSQQGPLVLPLFHVSTAPVSGVAARWPWLPQASRLRGQSRSCSGTPHLVSLCTPNLPPAQEGTKDRPLLRTLSSLEMPVLPLCLRLPPNPWAPGQPANAGHLRSYLSSSLAKAESAPAGI